MHFLYFSELNICSLGFATSGCCHPCFYCLSIVYIRKTTNNAYILILLYEEESFLYVKPSIPLEHIEFSILVKLYISTRVVSGYLIFDIKVLGWFYTIYVYSFISSILVTFLLSLNKSNIKSVCLSLN